MTGPQRRKLLRSIRHRLRLFATAARRARLARSAENHRASGVNRLASKLAESYEAESPGASVAAALRGASKWLCYEDATKREDQLLALAELFGESPP